LYADVPAELHKAAGRSVLSHLIKLVDDDQVIVTDRSVPSRSANFALRAAIPREANC